MANVLPPNKRKGLRNEYWLRLAVSAALVFSAALVVGIVMLLPAYIKANIEREGAERFKDIQDQVRTAAKNDTAVKAARLVRTQIDALTAARGAHASAGIERVLDHFEQHADNIIITSIQYDNKEAEKQKDRKEGKRDRSFRISGEARDRDALRAFVETLETDDWFADVRLPVSDLAESSGTRFSIVIVVQNDV